MFSYKNSIDDFVYSFQRAQTAFAEKQATLFIGCTMHCRQTNLRMRLVHILKDAWLEVKLCWKVGQPGKLCDCPEVVIGVIQI